MARQQKQPSHDYVRGVPHVWDTEVVISLGAFGLVFLIEVVEPGFGTPLYRNEPLWRTPPRGARGRPPVSSLDSIREPYDYRLCRFDQQYYTYPKRLNPFKMLDCKGTGTSDTLIRSLKLLRRYHGEFCG